MSQSSPAKNPNLINTDLLIKQAAAELATARIEKKANAQPPVQPTPQYKPARPDNLDITAQRPAKNPNLIDDNLNMLDAMGQLATQQQNEIINANRALKAGNYELAEYVLGRNLEANEIVAKTVSQPERFPSTERSFAAYENKTFVFKSDEQDRINQVTKTLTQMGINYSIKPDENGNIIVKSGNRIFPGVIPGVVPVSEDKIKEIDNEVKYLESLGFSPSKWKSQLTRLSAPEMKKLAAKVGIKYKPTATRAELEFLVKKEIMDKAPSLVKVTARDRFMKDAPVVPKHEPGKSKSVSSNKSIIEDIDKTSAELLAKLHELENQLTTTKDEYKTYHHSTREAKRLKPIIDGLEEEIESVANDITSHGRLRDIYKKKLEEEEGEEAEEEIPAVKEEEGKRDDDDEREAAPARVGDGIGVKRREYLPFGKYKIDTAKLDKNIIKFVTARGFQTGMPQYYGNKKFIDIIKKIVNTGEVHVEDTNELNRAEKDILETIIDRTRANVHLVDDTKVGAVKTGFNVRNPSYYTDSKLRKRLEILQGMREAGNDSRELVNEMTAVLSELRSRQLIDVGSYNKLTKQYLGRKF